MRCLILFFNLQFSLLAWAQDVTQVSDQYAPAVSNIALSDQEKRAPLFIHVDKSAGIQTMRVYKLGVEVSSFAVSTGREVAESNYKNPNFRSYCSTTPVGSFQPTTVKDIHNSVQWGGSNMYNSIFFKGGYAIHGVDQDYYSALGGRASGGCIRLTKENSKTLIDWVREVGQQNVQIKVIDSSANIDQYKIEDECFRQQQVVNCTQNELRNLGRYNSSNQVNKIVNGQVFRSYNIDRGEAYQIEEEVCRPRLAANGSFYNGPPRYSIRPQPRPANICVNQNLPADQNPCSDSYKDGLF